MSWWTTLLFTCAVVSAPPSEESSSNRPASINDRPRRVEHTDTQVVPATTSPTAEEPLPLADVEEPKDIESAPPAVRPGVVITPPTKRLERTRKKSASDDIGDAELPKTRSLAWWTTTGVGLAAVLVAIFLAGRVMKKALPGVGVGATSGPVQILDRAFLSPKHTICLVGCGDRLLIVGVSGDRIQTLSEVHDPREIDFIRGQLMQTRPKSTTEAFRQLLSGKNQLVEAKREVALAEDEPAVDEAIEPPKREFQDHLTSLRDQIARFKSRGRPA